MQNPVDRVVSLPFRVVKYDDKDRSFCLKLAQEGLSISYTPEIWCYEETINSMLHEQTPAVILPKVVYDWLETKIKLNWQSTDKLIAQALAEHRNNQDLGEWLKKDGSLFKLADAIRYGYQAEEIEIAPVGTMVKVPLEVTGHEKRLGKKYYQVRPLGSTGPDLLELTEHQIKLFLDS